MKKIYSLSFIFLVSFSIAKSQPGSVDRSFQPDFDFEINDVINTIATQNDDKVIIGGDFTVPLLFGNKPKNILRLNNDGTLDTNFKIGRGFDKKVKSIVLQADGKILVGGFYSKYDTIKCEKIVRLNRNGNFDISFAANSILQYTNTIALGSDNKILAGGKYKLPILVRIELDGRFLDASFNDNSVNGDIYSIWPQSNGDIIIGGLFSKINNVTRCYVAKINNKGNVVPSFDIGLAYATSAGVRSIVVQPDGKILVGGLFYMVDKIQGFIKFNIARFNIDGTLDTSFKTGTGLNENGLVNTIYLQRGGKIILGGSFDSFDRIKNKNIVRLNSDGSLDTTFKTGEGFDNQVTCIIPQGQNKIIVAGNFSSYDSYLFSRIIRLNIENSINELTVSIFPNPSSGIFKINSSRSLNLITITDASGKEILRTQPMAFDAEIDLSDKSPGMYFVKVFSETGSKCQKILKR